MFWGDSTVSRGGSRHVLPTQVSLSYCFTEKNKKLKPPWRRPRWSPVMVTPSVFRFHDRRFSLCGNKTTQHLKATANAVLPPGVNEIRILEYDSGCLAVRRCGGRGTTDEGAFGIMAEQWAVCFLSFMFSEFLSASAFTFCSFSPREISQRRPEEETESSQIKQEPVDLKIPTETKVEADSSHFLISLLKYPPKSRDF